MASVAAIMCRQIWMVPSGGGSPPSEEPRYVVIQRGSGHYGYLPFYSLASQPLPGEAAFLPAVPVDADTPADDLLASASQGGPAYLIMAGGVPAGLLTAVEWLPFLAGTHLPLRARLRELEEWKAHMESIFELSSSDLFTTDATGVVTRASALAEQLYGVAGADMIGKRVEELERQNTLTPSAVHAALRSGSPQVVVQRTASGRKLIVTATPVVGADGRVERVVGLVRDVTDAVALEHELHRNRQISDAFFEELKHYLRQQRAESGITAASDEMRRVLMLAEQVSEVDSSVLILGESGVGKEVIARRIHSLSPRRFGSFVKVDCGTLPEHLIEAELFGYERGAFTGAQREGKVGLVEMADNGTLFLDEIGEMPLSMQSKLLRFTQDREFYRVGGTKPVRVNLRIVSATNRDLAEEVHAGRFRRDLFYRLNVVPIRIPPLRDRREDIPLLVGRFLERFSERYDRQRSFSPHAMQFLMNYQWPGNVRQLENVVERLVVTTDSVVIQPQDLDQDVLPRRTEDGQSISVQEVIPLKEAIAAVEHQLLRLAHQRFSTEAQMAEALGVHQSTVSRMLQRYYGARRQGGPGARGEEIY